MQFDVKTVSILQPGYIPWLGFFEQLHRCDIFVLLDDVQFTKNDWRNRNRIKTNNGVQWLTVPVQHKHGQIIKDVIVDSQTGWRKKHTQSITSFYGKSKHFREYSDGLFSILAKDSKYLADIDVEIIMWLKESLGIPSEVVKSSDLHLSSDDKQYRLVEICRIFHASRFYEGGSGKAYIDPEFFKDHGITVEFQGYKHPYYNQMWMREFGFVSYLSTIDLLFNHGPDTLDILTGRQVIEKPEGVQVRHADEFKK